jgi:hypothetical protein
MPFIFKVLKPWIIPFLITVKNIRSPLINMGGGGGGGGGG